MKIKSTKERQSRYLASESETLTKEMLDAFKGLENDKLKVNDVTNRLQELSPLIMKRCSELNLTHEAYKQELGVNIENYIDKYPTSNISSALKKPFTFISVENRFNGYDWFYYNSDENYILHNQWNWGEILKSLHVYSNKERK